MLCSLCSKFPHQQIPRPGMLFLPSSLSNRLLRIPQGSAGTSSLRKQVQAPPSCCRRSMCAHSPLCFFLPSYLYYNFPRCEIHEGRDRDIFMMASSQSDTGPNTIQLLNKSLNILLRTHCYRFGLTDDNLAYNFISIILFSSYKYCHYLFF